MGEGGGGVFLTQIEGLKVLHAGGIVKPPEANCDFELHECNLTRYFRSVFHLPLINLFHSSH